MGSTLSFSNGEIIIKNHTHISLYFTQMHGIFRIFTTIAFFSFKVLHVHDPVAFSAFYISILYTLKLH